MRTVEWGGDHLVVIDQTQLPHRLIRLSLRTVPEIVDAIQRLAVRGAPAIGVTGALGVALVAAGGASPEEIAEQAAVIRAARPTAVNLAWAVDRVLAQLPHGVDAVVAEALRMVDEDVETNRALARRGADYVSALRGGPLGLHTHCNAGGLACVEWGTALGIVRELHERGLVREVFADETRPLLQGARLTAFELEALGIPYRIVVDGAAAAVVTSGMVDAVIVGADRIAANGDVANKIGTLGLALAAARAGVPFVVAAPESTVDLATPTGAAITIEERRADEVVEWAGVRTAPPGARAFNPAFDVTPADLVTAIVTEHRIVHPAQGQTMAR